MGDRQPQATGRGLSMAWFSETDTEGHTTEGRIGEAQCPVCGYPMLAKYDEGGELLEIIGSCLACKGEL